MKRLITAAAVLCGLLVSTVAAVDPCSFWVWQRQDPLSAGERDALAKMQATCLWHIGELDLSGASRPRWRWHETMPEPGATPVLRLNLSGADPFQYPGLTEDLATLADNRQGRLQIDCDCPDRLLAKYAQFLAALRKRVPHLSATALAGWSCQEAFPALQAAVEQLDVMFYDLTPDPAHIGPDNPPYPLLDERAFSAQLASWQNCKTPWRAGLPNFARVTVFDPTGHSLGQIRDWAWDDVMFQPQLKFLSAPSSGLVLMKADSDLIIARTPVEGGSTIAVRWVDHDALVKALAAVRKSAASGVVFFRLPDSSDPSGRSLAELREIWESSTGAPSLWLKRDGSRLVLENQSAVDLPPRIAADGDRGYALEVDAPVQLWRDAVAGDFWRVASHANPDKSPVAVPVPLSTRLTFWFPDLRSDEVIKSGPVQFAPGADLSTVRYRILPGDQAWKPLE